METAVEWLIKQLGENQLNGLYVIDTLEDVKNVFEQAKEMEKQQIFDAFVECWKENMPEGYECKQSAENYYNKTFKSE